MMMMVTVVNIMRMVISGYIITITIIMIATIITITTIVTVINMKSLLNLSQ